jgi:hypothetical protein
MNELLSQNYVKAFDHLVQLVRDVEAAIERAELDGDRLGAKQYQHLKKEYVQQLAELISRTPQSVDLQAVAH